MAAKKKPRVSFEMGMDQLEEMVSRMRKDEMPLDEVMKTYEEGMALAGQLESMLREHRRRIEQIDLYTAEITTFEENENGVS